MKRNFKLRTCQTQPDVDDIFDPKTQKGRPTWYIHTIASVSEAVWAPAERFVGFPLFDMLCKMSIGFLVEESGYFNITVFYTIQHSSDSSYQQPHYAST
jgi:hypothetical protein